jgi:hypothetical protein
VDPDPGRTKEKRKKFHIEELRICLAAGFSWSLNVLSGIQEDNISDGFFIQNSFLCF